MICNRQGCNREAIYQVGFRAHAPPPSHEIVEFGVNLAVCGYHREVSVGDIVGEDAWKHIVNVFDRMELIVPDRSSLEILLSPLDGVEGETK